MKQQKRPGAHLRKALKELAYQESADGWVPIAVALVRGTEAGERQGKVVNLAGGRFDAILADLLATAAEQFGREPKEGES